MLYMLHAVDNCDFQIGDLGNEDKKNHYSCTLLTLIRMWNSTSDLEVQM